MIRKDSALMRQMIEDIPIPPRPNNLIDFLNAVNQQDVSLQEVSKIIARDIAISAAILKTINSPYFEISQEIISIKQAITLLGLDNVSNLLFCFSLKIAFEKQDDPFVVGFWRQTNAVALLSAALAKRFTTKPSDEAFTFSMLCNVAVPAIAQVHEGYGEFYLDHCFGERGLIIDKEDATYFVNHTLIGEFITQSWNLPTFLVKGIAQHHNHEEFFGYELNHGNSSSIVYTALHYLAEHLYCVYTDRGLTQEWAAVRENVFNILGISDQLLNELQDDFFVLYNESEEALF